jgi:hypothetical protein
MIWNRRIARRTTNPGGCLGVPDSPSARAPFRRREAPQCSTPQHHSSAFSTFQHPQPPHCSFQRRAPERAAARTRARAIAHPGKTANSVLYGDLKSCAHLAAPRWETRMAPQASQAEPPRGARGHPAPRPRRRHRGGGAHRPPTACIQHAAAAGGNTQSPTPEAPRQPCRRRRPNARGTDPTPPPPPPREARRTDPQTTQRSPPPPTPRPAVRPAGVPGSPRQPPRLT